MSTAMNNQAFENSTENTKELQSSRQEIEVLEEIEFQPSIRVPHYDVSNEPFSTQARVDAENQSQLAVVWENLTAYKTTPKCVKLCNLLLYKRIEKVILCNISGYVKFGQLTAIMGPSGSGKSTLLKCLYGTSTVEKKGSLWVNRKHKQSAFIAQHEFDHLLQNLSVEESILYARRVKNATSGFRSDANGRDEIEISLLIQKLGLEDCRMNRVSKCSGGERKRLAIAQELAGDEKPDILFIDEPTSGLDSGASLKVVQQLRGFSGQFEHRTRTLAANPMTIVLTIHQPSYRLLKNFDQVYVLSVNGKCLYSGASGAVLKDHLLTRGLDCSDGNNPADVVIEAASISTSYKVVGFNVVTFTLRKIKCALFRLLSCQVQCMPRNATIGKTTQLNWDRSASESVCCDATTDETEISLAKIFQLENDADKVNNHVMSSASFQVLNKVQFLYATGVNYSFWHFWHLFRRSLLTSLVRKPQELLMLIVPATLMAYIVTVVYGGNLGQDAGCQKLLPIVILFYWKPEFLESVRKAKDVERNASMIFFSVLFLSFISMLPAIMTFPKEIKVFLSEKFNGWYNVNSYFWAKQFLEFPILYVFVYFFTMFIYQKTGQIGFYGDESRFHLYVFISSLMAFTAQGVAFAMGAMFPGSFISTILGSVSVLLFNVLFSGFFVRPSDGTFISYFQYLSFSKFALESLVIVIYGFNRCPESTKLFTENISLPFYKFNLNDGQLKRNVIILLTHLVFYRLVTYILLSRQAKPRVMESFRSKARFGNMMYSLFFSVISIATLIGLLFLQLVQSSYLKAELECYISLTHKPYYEKR